MPPKQTPVYGKKTGFTLLELLVVVAIITFLSSLSIIALAESQRNSRDKQRQVDMLTIIKAVELYTTDNGVPPAQITPLSLLEDGVMVARRTPRSPLMSYLMKPVMALPQLPPPPGSCKPPCIYQNGKCNCGVDGGGEDPPGGSYVCGNGTCETWYYENASVCWQDCGGCGNGWCNNGETSGSCPADCGPPPICNNNAICDASAGENIDNCPNDCYSSPPPAGGSSGGGVTCDSDGLCDAGETPGSCPADCTSSSMCYVSGEWDLCCLLGGSHCSSVIGYCEASTNVGCASSADCPTGESCVGTAQGGYYGVCNGSRCEQHYLLQRPAFSCTQDNDCAPPLGGGAEDASDGFVADSSSNFLAGLNPYLVSLPQDPGGKKACTEGVGGDTAETCERLRHYWCSSHPTIVKNHRFCCYASMENANNNIWPHPELLKTPTVDGDPRWTVLCAS